MDSCFRRNDIEAVVIRHLQASHATPDLPISFPLPDQVEGRFHWSDKEWIPAFAGMTWRRI